MPDGRLWVRVATLALVGGFGILLGIGILWALARALFLLDLDVGCDPEPAENWEGPSPPPTSDAESVWKAATDAERLALYNLAKEGFVSPAAAPVVHGLMANGARSIVRRQALSVRREDLRRYISNEVPAEKAREWESTDGSAWIELRRVLGVLGVLAIGVAVVTQRELLATSLGIASAVGVALPRLVHAFGLLGRTSRDGE
jgi:hypothetical protein